MRIQVCTPTYIEAENIEEFLRRARAALPEADILVLDDNSPDGTADIVCPDGAPCPTVVDGIVLRPKDGGHYEAEGADWVAPQLMDQLFTALRTLESRTTTSTTTPR